MKFEEARSGLTIDPLVAELTSETIRRHVEELESLLDAKSAEESIHQFLAGHSYFFNSILRMFGLSPLYSKVKLGTSYAVDFAWFDTGSYGPEWRLVEIEAPRHKLFTKSGKPSAHFTHALQQVRDWHAWIHKNLDFARKLMPFIEYPMAYLFMGRRSDLTDISRNRLRRIAYENRMEVEIHSLDWFLSAAKSTQSLLRPDGGGWPVPMRALTHADLAEGLPPPAKEWIAMPSVQETLDHFRDFRLQERDYHHPDP